MKPQVDGDRQNYGRRSDRDVRNASEKSENKKETADASMNTIPLEEFIEKVNTEDNDQSSRRREDHMPSQDFHCENIPRPIPRPRRRWYDHQAHHHNQNYNSWQWQNQRFHGGPRQFNYQQSWSQMKVAPQPVYHNSMSPYQPQGNRREPQKTTSDLDETLNCSQKVTSAAITRSIEFALDGETEKARQVMEIAISIIRKFNIEHDERGKVLIESMQDTLKSFQTNETDPKDTAKKPTSPGCKKKTSPGCKKQISPSCKKRKESSTHGAPSSSSKDTKKQKSKDNH